MLKLKHKLFALFFLILTLIGLGINTRPTSSYHYSPYIEATPTLEVKKANPTPIEGTHDFYHEVVNEVTQYVQEGKLDPFHLEYCTESSYQIPYVKFRATQSSFEYWASLSKQEVQTIFNRYYNNSKEFVTIMQNIGTPLYYLKRNQAIGFYFDGKFLNFLWTSEYLPLETYNLQSITLNGLTYKQQILDKGCSHLKGNGMFELTSRYCYPEQNIQLNMTPIGGFHYCELTDEVIPYGVGLAMKSFEVTGFEANYDAIQNGLNPGEEDSYFGTEYKIISNDNKTFNFSDYPEYQKNAMMQLASHVYIEITDIECQSMFVVNFGGYEHAVFFNTSLNLDDVYRVDVSYTLASDNKPWYNFIANDGTLEVAKSLTPATTQGGMFGLSTYQGLSKGRYQSTMDGAKTYQYRMFLNYDSDGWNLFKGGKDESKYTNVHNFKILRMNFLYKGQEVECEIKMDEIDGKSVSIFDKSAILDVDSDLWEYKEIANDIGDSFNNFFNDIKSGKALNVFYLILGTAGAILIFYLIFKAYKFIKKFISKE